MTNTTIAYLPLAADRADELAALETASFPNLSDQDLLSSREFADLAQSFPDGCFMALDTTTHEVVGAGVGILMDFDFDHREHGLAELMGSGHRLPHNPAGDWYYGLTIITKKSRRGQGIGRHLYRLRKDCVRRLKKAGIVAGGMIPGYPPHRDEMTARQYVDAVIAGDLYDPTLTFQLEEGFEVVDVIDNYVHNEATGGSATLIVWRNPDLP